ncbi:hypothetical protein FCV25MIE_34524 [Fagus crenata]
MFDGAGDLHPHLAHFLVRCGPVAQNGPRHCALGSSYNHWGKGGDLKWYAHLSEESIPTWEARVSEFSNIQRRVGVPKQLKTKQRDNEPITEFITRWQPPTFACPQKFTQQELLKMCMK